MNDKKLRYLSVEDYKKKYLELMSQLSPVGNISESDFIQFVQERQNSTVYTWVIEKDEIIITTISLLLERKFYHGGRYCGHVEDVIVHKKYRHLKLGMYIVNFVLKRAKNLGCYKVILDCREDLKKFYEFTGFACRNIQMSYYF